MKENSASGFPGIRTLYFSTCEEDEEAVSAFFLQSETFYAEREACKYQELLNTRRVLGLRTCSTCTSYDVAVNLYNVDGLIFFIKTA